MSIFGIFDRMHEKYFEELFGLDPKGRESIAAQLREMGVSEEDVQEFLTGGIRAKQSFGHAHEVDVTSVVRKAIFREGADSITLEVKRDVHPDFPEGWDGHLVINVLDVKRVERKEKESGTEEEG